jgi:xylose dehydrogenase (NAD/NADP)
MRDALEQEPHLAYGTGNGTDGDEGTRGTRMATGDPVRWGILGTGDINHRFLPGARQSPTVDVVAVGSRTAERARAFAAEFGVPRAHASYEDLLADPDVEAIYNCLPNSLHHEWTVRALAAGKHVLCEKPYTRRPAEVDEAFDAAERADRVLMEAFMWRHTPQTLRLTELLPTIGALQTIRAAFSWLLENEADIRVSTELDGGSLMDVGCYCVSGLRLIAGCEPERVYAEAVVDGNGVERRMTATMRFPGNVIAEFTSGFTMDHMGLEAIGRDGSIRLPDPWHCRQGVLFVNDEAVRVEPTDPYRLEVEDMARAIREGRPTRLGRADALGQARTIEALYRSADAGQPVTL